MASVTVTSQGQITIPAQVRRELGIETGQVLQLDFSHSDGSIILRLQPTLEDVQDFFAQNIDPQIPPLRDPAAFYREDRWPVEKVSE